MLRIHLDTDLGGDIDDLCALAMVLNWPDADLIAVTTVSDDQGRRAGYARYALRLAGREDIPVAAGADISLDCYQPVPGLPIEEAYWPEAIAPLPTPLDQALSLLESSIDQGATIAAIGPYTNLALLERSRPGILRKAHLYLMGGYVFPPREGFPPWTNNRDWNVQVDVQSSLAVLQHSIPTLVPISVTAETWLRRDHLGFLRRAGPLARLIAHQAEVYAVETDYETQYGLTCVGLPKDIINFQHDPLTCAIALGWNEGVEIGDVRLKLEARGGSLYQYAAEEGEPARVVTRIRGDRFSEFWLKVVARGEIAHPSDVD